MNFTIKAATEWGIGGGRGNHDHHDKSFKAIAVFEQIDNPQPPTTFCSIAAAEAAAPDDDEDLNCVVEADPSGSGRAIIQVYDAVTGKFVGNL